MLIEALLTRYLRYTNKNNMRFEITPNIALPMPRRGRKYLLYVHIPFCEALCPFCSFHRVKLDLIQALDYFRALRTEIKRYHEKGYDFSSVYVGGGTPTVMPEELGETLDLIRSLYSVKQISVETNPNHLKDDVLSVLKSVGVNRLSVGIQSFDDELLKEMERYKYGSGSEIVERLQNTQGLFDTLNADMIFNLPHQTLASLENDLQILTNKVQMDQVTFYPLMPSSTTQEAMSRQMGNGNYRREKRFYKRILGAMEPDYRPSSAWCFSRNASLIDEYIVDHDEYVGAGSGSFSYLNGVTCSSTFAIDGYINDINEGKTAICALRRHNRYEQMQYKFLVGLFGLTMDKAALEARYGKRFSRDLWKEFLVFRLLGAIKEDGNQYRLTKKGMYYWVVMMREFFIGVNNFRDQMRSCAEVERRTEFGEGEKETNDENQEHRT
jgi:coproporphyrinogen III oxidase-like Fe-S oxidoreductase